MRELNIHEIENLKRKQKTAIGKGIPKLRTAIYARKSANDEKQTSLDTQVKNCMEFIAKYDTLLEFKEVFQEDDRSGMFTEGRDEYDKMMKQAESGEIDVIVVMKLDRLARDISDATTIVKLLNLYNVTLLAGDDVNNADTPAGEFVRNIMFAQNQYHARRVASDVIRTTCNEAKKGKTVGGVAPYGLKTVNRQYDLEETEAPAVKIMFERIAAGRSYQQVIKELTDSGYRTRSGEKFSYSTLNSILRNEKYFGCYIYNREGGKKKKHRVLIEHVDEVRIEDNITPIVSKETFDKVQAVLDKRKTECRPHLNASNYVLTGLLFCKQCGKPMSGFTTTSTRKQKSYRNYVCPNHSKRNGNVCSTKDMNANYLECAVKSLITHSINDYLTDKVVAQNVLTCLEAPLKEQRTEYSRRVSDLEGEIKKLISRAANVTERIAQKYEEEAQECLNTQDSLKEKIAGIDAQLKTMQNMTESMVQGQMFTADEVFTSDERARELIPIFVERINIDENADDIEIIFRQM